MNVLLVDDESYVLDYLEENINWSALGIIHLFRAESAYEAMNILQQHAISILISDIRMPEKSGLDLLSEIRKTNDELKVILLTGYSEFEYAQQALQRGAVDYLLKPVTSEEVEFSLNKVIAFIQQKSKEQQQLEAAANVLRYGGTRMKEHFMLELLLGKRYSESELSSQLSGLHIPIELNDDFMIALLRIETGSNESSLEDLALFHYAIVNIAEEILKENGVIEHTLWTCTDSHHYLVLLLPTAQLSRTGSMKACIKQLHQAVQTYMKRSISILSSLPFASLHQLNQTYVQALYDFGRLIGTQRNVLLMLDQPSNERKMKPLMRLYEAPTILQLMESGKLSEASERLEHILIELDHPDYRTQEHAAEVFYHLYNCFSYLAHKQGDSLTSLIGPSSSILLRRVHSIEAIRDWALPLMKLFNESLSSGTGNQNRTIRQIQDYIEQNLSSDLSLQMIGEYVYLHPVYLSRLYKKETGESISSYITRIRLEKAAQLLHSTNKKVADIAVEVGYHKTQYFIQLFKDFSGHTPQAYRNK